MQMTANSMTQITAAPQNKNKNIYIKIKEVKKTRERKVVRREEEGNSISMTIRRQWTRRRNAPRWGLLQCSWHAHEILPPAPFTLIKSKQIHTYSHIYICAVHSVHCMVVNVNRNVKLVLVPLFPAYSAHYSTWGAISLVSRLIFL